jgi:hypothetical protein
MIRSILLLLIGSFVMVACVGEEKVPDKYIQPKKMQAVLLDLFTVDAVNSEKSYRDTAFKLQLQNKSDFTRVFQLHKISRAKFEESYTYYVAHPVLLKQVIDSLDAVALRRSNKVMEDTSMRTLKYKNGINLENSAR